MPVKKNPVRMQPRKLVALLQALREGEYNARELADMAGLHYNTTLVYLRALHEAHLIHTRKWEKDRLGRESVPIYQLKVFSDTSVQRPKITRAEQQRRYRKRKAVRKDVATVEAPLATLATRAGSIASRFAEARLMNLTRPPPTAPTSAPGGWSHLFISDDVDDSTNL